MMTEDQNVAFYGSQPRVNNPDLTSLPEPPSAYESPSKMKEPLTTNYTAQSYEVTSPPVSQRPKNFPPCRPVVHHSIKSDIEQESRMFVRKAYFGWYVHAFCIMYNFICMLGALIKGYTLTGFFVALAILLIGLPVSFFVYMLLYNAIRLKSASRFCLWFGFFVLQIAIEALYALGIESTGGAGLILMLDAFTNDSIALGAMFGISFALWLILVIYNVWFFNQARIEYRDLGGSKAATKEIGRSAVNTAYENRENIKEFAVEHKDTIKQVAIENKDAIIDFAKENKDTIAKVAYDNRQTIGREVVNNQDALFENKDFVDSMFQDSSKKH